MGLTIKKLATNVFKYDDESGEALITGDAVLYGLGEKMLFDKKTTTKEFATAAITVVDGEEVPETDFESMEALTVRLGALGCPGFKGAGSSPTPGGAVDSVNGETGVVVLNQDDVSDGATYKRYAATDKAKVSHLTVTQAVDLDAIETRVNALDAAIILKGAWDASAGTFPGTGTAQAGESWIVSVAGTVNSTSFAVNDRIIAILDNASTSTFAANWFKADYTDQVLSVAGKTGAVTLSASDLSDFAAAVAAAASVSANTSAIAANTSAISALQATVSTIKYVAIDQTTSSATAVNVTDIVFPAAANTKYIVRGPIHVGSSAANGARFGFNIPSGTIFMAGPNRGGSATGTLWSAVTTSGAIGSANNTFANGSGMAWFDGTITIGATGGNIQMIFASGTGGSDATIGAEGSYIEFIKVI